MSYHGNHVWIIGASSGIGKALAKELASQGAILAISSRDLTTLEELRNEIGLHHHVFPLDVTNRLQFKTVVSQISGIFKKIDRIVYLAAAYQPMSLLDMEATAVDEIVDVNLKGVFHFIQAAAPLIKEGNIGQIALCGSVAGYCGLPNGQPYSSTKAAVINIAQSLRAEVQNDIDVKLINPGFVRTALTDKNNFDMPMIIEPEQAAKEIANGLLSNQFEIHFPRRFTWLMKLIAILPYKPYFAIIRKLK